MQHCGFQFGIGWANKILIHLLKNNPFVYSVKLSGAGGGGSVFALVDPLKKQEILTEWKQKLTNLLQLPEKIHTEFPDITTEQILELQNAEFFDIRINFHGVSSIE